eukprot:gene10549-7323_t
MPEEIVLDAPRVLFGGRFRIRDRDEKERKIGSIKRNLAFGEICRGCPHLFVLLLNYARKMKFEEEPAYEMIRGLLKKELTERNEKCDNLFDWDVPAHTPTAEAAHPSRASPAAEKGALVDGAGVSGEGDRMYLQNSLQLQSDADAKGILWVLSRTNWVSRKHPSRLLSSGVIIHITAFFLLGKSIYIIIIIIIMFSIIVYNIFIYFIYIVRLYSMSLNPSILFPTFFMSFASLLGYQRRMCSLFLLGRTDDAHRGICEEERCTFCDGDSCVGMWYDDVDRVVSLPAMNLLSLTQSVAPSATYWGAFVSMRVALHKKKTNNPTLFLLWDPEPVLGVRSAEADMDTTDPVPLCWFFSHRSIMCLPEHFLSLLYFDFLFHLAFEFPLIVKPPASRVPLRFPIRVLINLYTSVWETNDTRHNFFPFPLQILFTCFPQFYLQLRERLRLTFLFFPCYCRRVTRSFLTFFSFLQMVSLPPQDLLMEAFTPLADICRDCPYLFVLLLNYARKIPFDETPSYDMITRLLERELQKRGELCDNVFDWDIPQEEKRHPSAGEAGDACAGVVLPAIVPQAVPKVFMEPQEAPGGAVVTAERLGV